MPDWLQHFHFLRPAWALLVLPWCYVCWRLLRAQSADARFRGIIAPHLLRALRLRPGRWQWLSPLTLTLTLVPLLALVLMGPSWRQQPSPLVEDEAALVIVLDASASMTQRDIQPSRLARAQQKISDLLALRAGKRAALVVYAGSAHVVLTLTPDASVLNQYVGAISPGIMPRSGKFPEYALPRIDSILAGSTAPATVLLLTDGVGAASEPAFTDWFDTRPHQLLVWGIGSSATDGGGAPLEVSALQALARAGGGRYIALSIDASDVRTIDRRIDSYYTVRDDDALPWLDAGYWLLFPCLLLFLPWFRRGWTLSWMWLLCLPLLFAANTGPVQAAEESDNSSGALQWFADLWLTPDQQGRLLLQRGDYRAAGQHFADPMWQALSYYYAEDFMLAAEYFSRSDTDDALFNEANARAHARDYKRAVNRYDRLLARNPRYPGAAQNRARVQALVDEINRLSESQQADPGSDKQSNELDADDAIPADGAEEISWQQGELKQLSAEDILQDPATSEMWLRGVQRDPADFLAGKFQMQLQQQEDSP